MAHYFVGDIQGCFTELTLLLDKVGFNPSKDELWTVGDLIARGPDSLKTMEFFLTLGDAAKTVLGNHDLHLLSLLNGHKKPNPMDKLQPLLDSPNKAGFIEFIRHQPLVREIREHNLVMTHAGVPPQWTLSILRREARLVSDALKRHDYLPAVIDKMYTQTPSVWQVQLTGVDRLIYTINGLTRMRYLHPDGSLDFQCKQPPSAITDPKLIPWFEYPSQLESKTKIVFGHWAALMGKTHRKNRLALDTGCCWGEYMSLWHLETNEFITQKAIVSPA